MSLMEDSGKRGILVRNLRNLSLVFLTTILLVALLGLPTPTQAQVLYTVIELGQLPGDSESMASGLNNRGEVVGVSIGGPERRQRGFYWRNGVMEDMGEIPGEARGIQPTSINDNGVAVGYTNYTERGFIWTRQNGFSVQEPPPPGARSVRFTQINNQNGILGTAYLVGSIGERVFYLRNGAWDFFSTTELTIYGRMNNSGDIPLQNGVHPRYSARIVNREELSSVNLRQLFWSDSYSSGALAIDDFGVALCLVDGRYYLADIPNARILPEIPRPDKFQSFGGQFIMNNARDILGEAFISGQIRQVLFSGVDRQWHILTDLVPPSWVQRWRDGVLFTGMNDAGQIIGRYNVGGQWHAFLLTRDSDGDGLPDEWEKHGYTHGGKFVDLPRMGANPNHKDIFVYVDYLDATGHCHRPSEAVIERVKKAFVNAPVDNPDGLRGINLRVILSTAPIREDAETEIIGEMVDVPGQSEKAYAWDEFEQIKLEKFPSELSPAFHYCIFGHNGPNINGWRSGIARGVPASDFLVTLGTFTNQIGAQIEQAGTFMHELGHNLGLHHGGPMSLGVRQAILNGKPNYLSVMNYTFQNRGLIKDGKAGYLSYSSVEYPILDENHLNEFAGLVTGFPEFDAFGTRWTIFRSDFPEMKLIPSLRGAINWNDNFDVGLAIIESNVSEDINNDSKYTVLRSANDWAALNFRGGWIGFSINGSVLPPQLEEYSGISYQQELTFAESQAILPLEPSGLTTRAARGTVRLSWNISGPPEDCRYRIYRRIGNAAFSFLATTSATAFQDSGLSRGTQYQYVVTTQTMDGAESNPSVTASVTVP